MENFIVSARKYRPQTFETVVGQRHVTDTLQNAIRQNHLAQALLFTGPRGVGKTTCARILARAINAEDGQNPDDAPLNIFELDAASNNSVDDIRNLIDQVRFAPQVGRYKIYIIDEVHMLSQAAFNAFLKTLEEPPAHAIFILATTEKHKIIPTILSRCQIFDFRRITVDDIAQHLAHVASQEGITAEEEALHLIAQKADGALRDALSLFDRMVSFSGNTLTYKGVVENLNLLDYDVYFKAMDLVVANNHAGLLLLFDDVLKRGFDGQLFLNGLADHLRNLLVASHPDTINLIEGGSSLKARYGDQAKAFVPAALLSQLKALNEADVRYKNTNNQRLLVEVSLLALTQLGTAEKKNTDHEQPIAAAPVAAVPKPAPAPVVVNEPSPEKPAAAPVQSAPVVQQEPTPILEPTGPTPPPVRTPPTLTTRVDKPAPKAEPSAQAPSPKEQATPKANPLARFSLKNIAPDAPSNESSEGAPEAQPQGPETPVTLPRLTASVASFSTKLSGSRKALVDGLKFEVKGASRIETQVDSQTAANTLADVKNELMPFLREDLKNQFLQMDVVVRETAHVKPLLTSREIYEDMRSKNPLVDDLRRELGLEFE